MNKQYLRTKADKQEMKEQRGKLKKKKKTRIKQHQQTKKKKPRDGSNL